MVDWSQPIEAADDRGSTIAAKIDPTYAVRSGLAAVRLSRNLFAGDADPGTWYFNDEGQAPCGIGEHGYEARYTVRNLHG
jgi:hypothetical protein